MFGLMVLLAVGWAAPAKAADDSVAGVNADAEITVRQLYDSVARFAVDLERLRLEMGRPPVGPALFTVENAVPHNVHEVAKGLLARTNRRASEFGIDALATPAEGERADDLSDMLVIIETAHRQLGRICQRLDVSLQLGESRPARSATPGDVIESILRCNRQLNLIMDEPLKPNAVYAEVSRAITYVRSMSGERCDLAIVDQAPFVPQQKPEDVYGRLRETYRLVGEIGGHVGVTVPTLEFSDLSNVVPSDVYDFVVLIVAHLGEIHTALTSETGQFRALHFPGPRFPSHVYQRVGTLNGLLDGFRGELEGREMVSAGTQP